MLVPERSPELAVLQEPLTEHTWINTVPEAQRQELLGAYPTQAAFDPGQLTARETGRRETVLARNRPEVVGDSLEGCPEEQPRPPETTRRCGLDATHVRILLTMSAKVKRNVRATVFWVGEDTVQEPCVL